MTTSASRREFMRLGTLASAVAVSSGGVGGAASPGREVQEAVERAMSAPLLRKALWREPVLITSVDVLKAPWTVSDPRPLAGWCRRHSRRASRCARDDMADLDGTGRAIFPQEGRTRARGAHRRRVPRQLELQVAGPSVLGAGREPGVCDSGPARQSGLQATRRAVQRDNPARCGRVSREREPRQHTRGRDCLPSAPGRGNRREGDQVPPRRAHEV